LFLLSFLADVRGVVVDPSGKMVPGAQVVCGSETTATDDQGAFRLGGSAKCEGRITKAGFAPQTATLEPDKDNRVELTLASVSDRVVVSATGAPVALEEAGVAATVITAREIEVRQHAPVAEMLRDVPGLSVVQTGSGGGIVSVFTRGGGSNATVVLLDGVPVTDPGGALNFAYLTTPGLEKIEVIRGPESALFGAEASSGVIQFFSKRGDPEARIPHGSAVYERGSFSTDRWTGSLSGGLGGRLDYALTADQHRTTGQFPNNVFRNDTGTANLGFRLSDSTNLRAVYRTFDSYTGTPGTTYYGVFNHDARQFVKDHALSLKVDDARGSRFSQTGYFAYHRLRSIYQDFVPESYRIAAMVRTVPGTPARTFVERLVDPSTTVADPGTNLVSRQAQTFPGTNLSITSRASANYQGSLMHKGGTLVFGYQGEQQGGFISRSDVDRFNNGVSLYDQVSLGRRVSLAGGARIEHSSIFGGRFAPRGAVTFQLPTNTYLRLSLARGIKEPSLLETFARESFYVGNPNLRVEKTDSFEAGLYREWFGRRVRTEAAYFRNLYHDLIQYVTDPQTFIGSWQNVDRSWARGLELSGSGKVARFVTVRASYTRLYSRVVRSQTAADIGQELPRRPRNSATLGLELTPRRWTLAVGARILGQRRDVFTAFGNNYLQGFENAYLNGSWQINSHLAPFIRINNLADQTYQEVSGYGQWSRHAVGGLRITW
jgi:vitamin B12 transporter